MYKNGQEKNSTSKEKVKRGKRRKEKNEEKDPKQTEERKRSGGRERKEHIQEGIPIRMVHILLLSIACHNFCIHFFLNHSTVTDKTLYISFQAVNGKHFQNTSFSKADI